MAFDFAAGQTIGTIVRLDDQEFELVGERGCVRRDGSPGIVFTWLSTCPVCESHFEQTTGRSFGSFLRRCDEHRKAGKPVKGKRGRKVRVEVLEP